MSQVDHAIVHLVVKHRHGGLIRLNTIIALLAILVGIPALIGGLVAGDPFLIRLGIVLIAWEVISFAIVFMTVGPTIRTLTRVLQEADREE